MIDALFKLICFLFHRGSWRVIDSTVDNGDKDKVFDYWKYNCLKCGTMFWDSPFDPHIDEEPKKPEPMGPLNGYTLRGRKYPFPTSSE